jgi:hypothetical protein
VLPSSCCGLLDLLFVTCRTVDEFNREYVLKMGVCAEGAHITLGFLSVALGCRSHLVFLTNRPNENAVLHMPLPEDAPRVLGDVHLLFRPGHYDLLYAKEDGRPEEAAGSSPNAFGEPVFVPVPRTVVSGRSPHSSAAARPPSAAEQRIDNKKKQNILRDTLSGFYPNMPPDKLDSLVDILVREGLPVEEAFEYYEKNSREMNQRIGYVPPPPPSE